jgi:hypothetical protein
MQLEVIRGHVKYEADTRVCWKGKLNAPRDVVIFCHRIVGSRVSESYTRSHCD